VTERSLRRVGTTSMTLFAFVWAVAGTGAYPALRPVILGAAVLIAVLILAPTWFLRRRDDTLTRRLPSGWWRNFQIVGGVQFAAIALVVFLAIWADAAPLIPSGVALVVGLHFLPLRSLFRDPIWLAPAAGLIVVAVTGATLYFVSGPAAGIVAATLGSAMVLFAVAALVAFLPAHPRVAAAQRVGRAGGGP